MGAKQSTVRFSAQQIAEAIGKPIASVRSRASNLGLKQRVAWSEAEYESLRASHEDGESLGTAAQKIGRPYANVARVAVDLGLNFKASRVEVRESKPAKAKRAA